MMSWVLCGAACSARVGARPSCVRRCCYICLQALSVFTPGFLSHTLPKTQQYLSPEHAKAVSGNNSQGPVYKLYVRLLLCAWFSQLGSNPNPQPLVTHSLPPRRHPQPPNPPLPVLHGPPAREHYVQPGHDELWHRPTAAKARQERRARPRRVQGAPRAGGAEGEQARHVPARRVWDLHARRDGKGAAGPVLLLGAVLCIAGAVRCGLAVFLRWH